MRKKTPHANLHARGNGWAYRRQIPRDLQPIFGKTEIIESLRGVCSSHGDAVNEAHRRNKLYTDTFAKMRQAIKRGDAATIVQEHARQLKLDLGQTVKALLDPASAASIRAAGVETISAMVEQLAGATVSGIRDAMQPAMDRLISLVSIPPRGAEPAFVPTRPVKVALTDAVASMVERRSLPEPFTMEQLQKEPAKAGERVQAMALDSLYGGTLDDDIALSAPALAAVGVKLHDGGPLALSRMREQWLYETQFKERQQSTVRQHTQNVDMLIKAVGDLSILDPSLYDATVNYLQSRVAAGKSQATVEKEIASLEELGAWFLARYRRSLQGVINPFDGLLTDARARFLPSRKGAVSEQRHGFRGCQVREILSFFRERWGADDHSYIALVLMAATAARSGEITNLRPQDIRQEKGQWVVDINTDADSAPRPGFDRTTKTDTSPRLLPLHKDAIPIVVPFAAKRAGAFRLLELVGSNDDQVVKLLGNRFTSALRYVSRKTGESFIQSLIDREAGSGKPQDASKLSLYSFRHAGGTLFELKWGPKSLTGEAILGHAASRYGEATDIVRVSPEMYRAEFDGLAMLGAP